MPHQRRIPAYHYASAAGIPAVRRRPGRARGWVLAGTVATLGAACWVLLAVAGPVAAPRGPDGHLAVSDVLRMQLALTAAITAIALCLLWARSRPPRQRGFSGSGAHSGSGRSLPALAAGPGAGQTTNPDSAPAANTARQEGQP